MKEDEIRHRWQEYFDKLFNGENENSTGQLDNLFDDSNGCFVRGFQVQEVREALKRVKFGKAFGPDGIPIKVWRVSWGFNYSMASKNVQQYLSIEQDA